MWEMGKRNPSFEALEQLSIVFDRTMSYILGESDDPSSPELGENEIQKLGLWSLEEDYMEIMMKYLRLDERGKAAVDALINAEFKRITELFFITSPPGKKVTYLQEGGFGKCTIK